MPALIKWLLNRLGFPRALVSQEVPLRVVLRGSEEATALEEAYRERQRKSLERQHKSLERKRKQR